jgi:outer membrane lipoprotein-sorting protein
LHYNLINDTTINNNSCYQIEVSGTATKDKSSAVLVVRKDSNFIVLATRYNENHKAVSQTQLSDYKKIDGDTHKMYPMHIVTTDYENNKNIAIRILDISAKSGLTKSAFTF